MRKYLDKKKILNLDRKPRIYVKLAELFGLLQSIRSFIIITLLIDIPKLTVQLLGYQECICLTTQQFNNLSQKYLIYGDKSYCSSSSKLNLVTATDCSFA